jgi:hypothetical protein
LMAMFTALEIENKISWSWINSPVWSPIASYVAFWVIIIAIFSITGYVVARLLHVRS